MMQKNSLKRHLFLVPAVSVILISGTVFCAFNLVFERYIQKEASRHIGALYEKLDSYHQNTGYDGFYDTYTDFVMQVQYVIVDAKGVLVFPESQWATAQEMERAKAAAKSFEKAAHPSRINAGKKFVSGRESFFMQARNYIGSYDSFFIDAQGTDSYTVLAYVNITPLQSFLNTANHILLILIPVTGLISILLIFFIVRKVDVSFARLSRYIMRLGQRKEKNRPQTLAFSEFNALAQTVYRMAEQIERAEERQKQFFQNASHELKTPLASIQGYAEAIRSGVGKDADESAEVILRASKKMSSLVDEILLLSQMDSKMDVMETELLEIKELLYGISWEAKERAEQKGVEIIHDFLSERIFVHGDESKLERAFSNILTNALRYARSKIRIECSAGEDTVYICIEDDGDGIDAGEIEHIFERFYKGRGGNFGIGLSITKEIISAHRGKIHVSSEQGCTKFNVELRRSIQE